MRHLARIGGTFFVVALLSVTPLMHPLCSDASETGQTAKRPGSQSSAYIRVKSSGNEGAGTTRNEMSVAEAKAMYSRLQALEQALTQRDESRATRIAHALTDQGIFQGNRIFSLIHRYCRQARRPPSLSTDDAPGAANVLSLVMGSGEGVLVYPLDLMAYASAIYLYFLLDLPMDREAYFLYTWFIWWLGWIPLSHLIPCRAGVQPLVWMGITDGALTTVGLKGVQTMQGNQSHTVIGSLTGFTGLIVNVYIPRNASAAYTCYFILGTAIAVYPYWWPASAHFLHQHAQCTGSRQLLETWPSAP